MTIYKILNNNLILSKDKQGHEIIVRDCISKEKRAAG